MTDDLAQLLERRFGESFPSAHTLEPVQAKALAALAGHASVRRFAKRPVTEGLVELLCACALSAPSKSDLQLRDVVVVRAPERRAALAALAPSATFLSEAPVILVFCGNAGRLAKLLERSDLPFVNNHADLLVNAVADAAIALGWLQAAVNLIGLGGCGVSVVRDRATDVAALLELPPMVFPFAAFALGWPDEPAVITPRLPLALTLHEDRFKGTDDPDAVTAYDLRREASGHRSWASSRARQYSEPLRVSFGAFLRKAGFNLR